MKYLTTTTRRDIDLLHVSMEDVGKLYNTNLATSSILRYHDVRLAHVTMDVALLE
jgi:hypothetical protein